MAGILLGSKMSATYDLLKITTVVGTVFSIYHAFTATLLLEDLLLVTVIAIALVATAKETKTSDQRHGTPKANPFEKSLAEGLEEKILTP